MIVNSLTSMPVSPEEFDTEHIDKLDFSCLHSEMDKTERRFINGLIRYFKPENILEIGVSRGGGTAVLLNAISDISESKLISIDRMDNYYGDENISVGSDVHNYFGDNLSNWTLYKGKDPSEVLDSIKLMFDFVIIDTENVHPIESLNFLCVLPYLKDGAIVVLHDISLFTRKNPENGTFDLTNCLAPRILLSSLTGEKLFPKVKSRNYISDDEFVNNIVAVQIDSNTRKYINNVFYSLALPWHIYPVNDIKSISLFLKKHYNDVQLGYFEDAKKWYFAYLVSNKITFSLKDIKDKIKNILSGNVIFYGAGKNMKLLINYFDFLEIPFNYPIWDIDADKIKSIYGNQVYKPDFKNIVSDTKIIITIGNNLTVSVVTKKLQSIGFQVIKAKVDTLEFFELNQVKKGLGIFNITNYPVEFNEFDKNIIDKITSDSLTMVSYERLFATLSSCKYVIENNIRGDFVECGVWRGGNAILAAAVFKHYGSDKKVWLFDTFEGYQGYNLSDTDQRNDEIMKRVNDSYYNNEYCNNSLEDVKDYFKKYGLLNEKINFVKGDIMKTLDMNNIPEKISVLRLDTDLYESTLKELNVLYPLLSKAGVLMVDDYGYAPGSKVAVDEYFADKPQPLMNYIDSSGRLAIKILN